MLLTRKRPDCIANKIITALIKMLVFSFAGLQKESHPGQERNLIQESISV